MDSFNLPLSYLGPAEPLGNTHTCAFRFSRFYTVISQSFSVQWTNHIPGLILTGPECVFEHVGHCAPFRKQWFNFILRAVACRRFSRLSQRNFAGESDTDPVLHSTRLCPRDAYESCRQELLVADARGTPRGTPGAAFGGRGILSFSDHRKRGDYLHTHSRKPTNIHAAPVELWHGFRLIYSI